MPDLFYTAAYIRLSREDGDREESDSVANQKKLLTGFIEKKEELLLYNMYIDDGYSGVTFQRPAFRRMLADIENKKITCVIVKDLSRFGRDYIESGRYLERYFPEKGIRFISVSDHIDSLRQPYDMLLPIKNIFNEQYARDISGKVHSALQTKRQCGEFIGAFASYGYRKSPTDKNKLIIDEYAASVVRRIFSLYLQGFGKQQIARLLNSEGVLCPSAYKRASGLRYANPGAGCGSLWSYSTINHILHKEIYVGNMVQGTREQKLRGRQQMLGRERWIVVRGTHEAIIDEETWRRTQKLLKSNVRSPAGAYVPVRHLFAGLLFCGGCGRPMIKTIWRHADGSPEYSFTCGTCKRHGRHFCTPHTIPARALEQAVLNDLNLLLSRCKKLSGLVWQQAEQFFDQPGIESELQLMENERKRARDIFLTSYEDYKSGLLSREEFLVCREKYHRKEQFCRSKQEELTNRRADFWKKVRQSPLLNEKPAARPVSSLDRALLSALIAKITVYENRRIHICYNFPGGASFFPGQYFVKRTDDIHILSKSSELQ